jgi:hypothetical protein
MAVSIKMAVFWDGASCIPVEVTDVSEVLPFTALMMEAVSTLKKSVNYYQTTRLKNLLGSHLDINLGKPILIGLNWFTKGFSGCCDGKRVFYSIVLLECSRHRLKFEEDLCYKFVASISGFSPFHSSTSSMMAVPPSSCRHLHSSREPLLLAKGGFGLVCRKYFPGALERKYLSISTLFGGLFKKIIKSRVENVLEKIFELK